MVNLGMAYHWLYHIKFEGESSTQHLAEFQIYAAHSRSIVVDFHVINKRALLIFKMPKHTNQYKDVIQQEWYMNMEKKG